MPDSTVVNFENVSHRFGPTRVLEDVSFHVHDKDATCIIGPNGGGKTTLLRLLLGLIQPTKGKIEVFGQTPRRSRQRIGYVPQAIQYDPLFPINALEIVLMGRLNRLRMGRYSPACKEVARHALEEVGLSDAAGRPFAALSGGQRQRVLIARALATEPDLLLMDEPTASVDLTVEAQFLETLEKLIGKVTILLVSHDLDVVRRLTDSVLCVNHTVHRHALADLTGETLAEIYSGEHRKEHERKTLHAQGDHSHCKHE